MPYASSRDHISSALTNVDVALTLERDTEPDSLAISVDIMYRIESGCVQIDFSRFTALREALSTSLVIYSTSSIRPADVQQLAANEVCKFNIGACLRQRFGSSLRATLDADAALFDRLAPMRAVIPQIADETEAMIRLLGQ